MYEAAIQRTQDARRFLESGDVWARARAITRASNILLELRASLKPEAGAIAGRLDRLYRYMQKRLQDAHIKKSTEPLMEVEKILTNLLEAWRKVEATERANAGQGHGLLNSKPQQSVSPYGPGLLDESPGRTLALSA